MTVLAPDGSALIGGVDSANALRAHWGPAFSDATGISAIAADRFLHYAQSFTGEVHRLDYDDVCAVASHVNRSSPGPDGVPYQAWLGGGGLPLRLVYLAYVSLTDGVCPPPDFNSALLIFIPKGGSLPGMEGYEGKASQFRPLTLSNSRQKLITKAFGVSLEHIAMQVTHPAQRGFVRGRKKSPVYSKRSWPWRRR